MKNPLWNRKDHTQFIARCMLVVLPFTIFTSGRGQTMAPPYPVKRIENRQQWERDGRLAVERAKLLRAQRGHAKNVMIE
jgi:hypothetical protein